MRKIKLFAALLAFATGGFWVAMATGAPKAFAEAARASISAYEIIIPAGLASPDGADTF
ncbi:MAG TPA: hypothetical protein VGC68_03100 [Enterovirga sp.]|jgi:hypothetical protein